MEVYLRVNLNNMPKVSIIVPVYNVESYIDRCMQSLLNQTLKDIEIILVDDGSPDNCPKICDEYVKKDFRVKVIHKKNEGLGYARNSGLSIATGDFVAFVDSDDYVSKDMYEKLYNYADVNNLDTVYCCYSKVKSDNTIINRHLVNENMILFTSQNKTPILEGMLCNMPGKNRDFKYGTQVWIALYSNKIIKSQNIKFCSERDFISEDIIFHIDYLPHTNRIGYIKDCLYYYCYNPASLTKKYKPGRFDEDLKLVDEMDRRLSLLYEKEYYRLRISRFLLFKARASISYECESLPFKLANKSVYKICTNQRIKNVLSYYPISKLSKKEYLFYWLMRHNFNYTITIFFKILHKIKYR